MASISPSVGGKGKERATEFSDPESESESASSASTTSESESDTSSDSEEEITDEYLQSLLRRARESAAATELAESQLSEGSPQEDNEDVLILNDEQPSLPKLNPGSLPSPYLRVGETRGGAGVLVRDPEVEEVEKKASSSRAIVSPPLPPPELTKTGKPLTKREKKELKKQTAGPDWFDMLAPPEVDLPRLHREVEALRLRNHMDPKRFYRKDEGEGKGVKGLPKYFAIGQVIATDSPFGSANSDNLPKTQRKRTLVDELIDDAETRRYAKKKFNELQTFRSARGRHTLRAKQALRKPKW